MKYVLGKVHRTRTGEWLELADEKAGPEANTFNSREAAEAARAELVAMDESWKWVQAIPYSEIDDAVKKASGIPTDGDNSGG